MAFDRRRYPPEWPEIRAAILERAGNCCEGTPQHPHCRARNYEPHPETGSRVVLTIAHWPDWRPENCAAENLHCLCQRCHLLLDQSMHQRIRRQNRERRARRLQPVLFEEERR